MNLKQVFNYLFIFSMVILPTFGLIKFHEYMDYYEMFILAATGITFILIFVDGSFFSQGSYGYWWSSSSFGSESWARGMLSEGPEVIRSSFDPRGAFSVRCLQDEE